MLYRYVLSHDGFRNVGFITGGYALGILDEVDYKHINETLKIPKLKKCDCISYFTELGKEKYSKLIEKTKSNLKTERNILSLSLIEIRTQDANSREILYQDQYQVIIGKLHET